MSDLLDLAKSMTPKKRSSRLDPYLAELRTLKEQGYSLEQMRELLAKVDVKVSRQTIHDFLERRAKAGIKTITAEPSSIQAKEEPSALKHTASTVPTMETTNTKNETQEPNEKPKRNPFRDNKKPDGDIRRNQFEYDPKPDLKKIYGENNDE